MGKFLVAQRVLLLELNVLSCMWACDLWSIVAWYHSLALALPPVLVLL